MKRIITVLLIVAAIGAGAGAYYIRRGGPEISVNTSPITRGDIIDTVGATGTLQAVTTVQVGSQVSGNIAWLGADFNSIVKKDQVIAKLDPSLFDAQLQQARANLSQARANQTKALSDLERSKVMLLDAQQKYTRSKELAARSLVPQSDLDAAKIAVDSAQASLNSQQATVAQTLAAISQSEASVNQNQVNLDHTVITAPIDGIITQRSVDVGQTVAASMQAPTLFIIAADLTKMQVTANIDESDVGRIRPGQHVTFRVDAYPTDTFEGTVSQIRLQPQVIQNVTTYGTVIDVPNGDLKLKPGMTANVKVEIAKRTDALRLPNAALRFRPTTEIFAALNQPVPPEVQFAGGRGAGRGGSGDQSGDRRGGGDGRGGFDPARQMERFKSMSADEQKQFIARMKGRGQDVSEFEKAIKASSASAAIKPKYGAPQSAETIDALFAPLPVVESRGRAWLFMDHQLKVVNLRLGITDGTNTELLGEALQQNMEVVTSVTGLGATRNIGGPQGTGNPLIPQRGGPPGGRGGGR
ncbi:MAG: efflux RND transporter periplasmic adaptor subunit [Acidobacteria bacterium]|nr:efflux RND transporter periplasmic adaptor subunit [Acidobacteriota bacterium]